MKRYNFSFYIVFLSFLAFVAAYDYQDEFYNQLIKHELEDLEEITLFTNEAHPLNVRRRKRDEESSVPPSFTSSDKSCRKRRWRMCCGEETMDRIVEKDRDIKKECFREVASSVKEEKGTGMFDPFSCEKIQKIKKEWACIVQCVGQKKHFIDDSGNFDEKELLSYYKKELGNDGWLYQLIEKAFPKCIELSNNGTTFVKDANDPLSCNPAPIKMHHCMWKELQMTCPNDKITDHKTCSKIREKIKKYDYLPFRHHHHEED